MKCGLLGRKLGHSYSPQIHSLLGDYSYELFEQEPEQIADFLENGDWTGINVTVPYKKTVIPYLDELSPIAARLGAVNTIIRKNGRLIGHNTDYFGFQMLLETLPFSLENEKVLVLGSGGASNTAVAVLEDAGAHPVIISRTGENNYTNLCKHRDASLIVNTTPVGMYPHNGESPIPNFINENAFPHLEGVVDVIYNPSWTKLLLDAESRAGILTANGLLMLVAQAKEAAQWFTGASIPNEKIQPILKMLEKQMLNIVLIGMPGCGKSTIGKLLAERTGHSFVDADSEIVRISGKSIPDIFAEDGEAVFREWETKVLKELGKQSGLVIATGGGCVTQSRNYEPLHQNGKIIWIQRNLENLPTDGRPLSQNNSLEQMYRIRKPLYESFADYIIENDCDPADAVNQILHILEV